ncbi:cysteine proteinase inhibitor 3-like [Rhododendron vialii]|uniref:cysteine proteinase inhibitor 3-like n=1 Tax=Rhododendron vialii TaxID=182163 RepID=UPI00265DC4D0|nr:cysteine proteinase inhibitor 3-like [Rhododendron vialii]
MEVGTVLYQQDVEGIPQLATLKGAVEVQLPNGDADVVAKWAVYEYNKKHGTHLEFESTLAAYKTSVALGAIYAILLKAKDCGKSKVYFAAVLVTPVKKFLLLFVHIYG